METAIIVDILRRAGAKVIVASVETEHTVGGTSNPIRPVAKPFRCNQLDHTDNCCFLRNAHNSLAAQPPARLSVLAVTATPTGRTSGHTSLT